MDHSFDIVIAKKYGMAAAVLYRNFQYWIAKNKANGKNFKDGRTWTYNSWRALVDLHPYLSDWDVRQALKTLVNVGVLIAANYNEQGYDRTTWYAFKDEKTALEGLPAHLWNPRMGEKPAKKPFVKSTNGLVDSANALVKSTDQYQIQKPNALPDKNKTKEVAISVQKVLELDLLITQGKNFLMKQLAEILRPNGREAKTFARIVRYMVQECQACKLPVSIFKDAVEWARQAKASTASNKKGLFVAKIKQETGFKAQKQILKKV
jgi:hypothetical protein